MIMKSNAVSRPLADFIYKSYKSLNNKKPNSKEQQYAKLHSFTSVKDKSILFESHYGKKVACNPLAIFSSLLKNKEFSKYECIWVINKGTIIPDYIRKYNNVRFVIYQSKQYLEVLCTAKFLINNNTFPSYFSPKENQVYINTYHGIPIKKMGKDINDTLLSIANTQRNFILAKYLISNGEYTDKHLYGKYGINGLLRDSVKCTGFPRISMPAHHSREDLFNQLDLDKNKKVVFYAPTWRGKRSTYAIEAQKQLEKINELYHFISADYNVIVSLHSLIKNYADNLPQGVTVVPDDIDVNEVFSITDILISDYSSILIDYIKHDKPLILYAFDMQEYTTERGMYIELNEVPAELCMNALEVKLALANSKRPSEFPQYQDFVNRFLTHDDELSGERAISLITEHDQQSIRTASVDESKKKILILMNALQNNGITNSLINLTHNIDPANVELYIILDASATDNNPIQLANFHKISEKCNVILRCGRMATTSDEHNAITLHSTNTPTNGKQLSLIKKAFQREAKRLLGNQKFDVVIDFAGYSPYWTEFACAVYAKRRVILQHNDMEAERTNPLKNHKRLISVFRNYTNFDVIAGVSKDILEQNKKNLASYANENSKFLVMTNTININKLLQLAKVPLSASCPSLPPSFSDKGLFKFVHIARLSPEKNQFRLLDAFAQVIDEGIKAVLIILGDGPLLDQLKRHAAKRQISNWVMFLGHIDNPYPTLQASDCFVLSSDYEGQPMTLLEALTLGVPCVATDIPGNRSVIAGGYGVLCAPTVNGLANAMIDATKNKIESKKFEAENYNKSTMDNFYEVICGI